MPSFMFAPRFSCCASIFRTRKSCSASQSVGIKYTTAPDGWQEPFVYYALLVARIVTVLFLRQEGEVDGTDELLVGFGLKQTVDDHFRYLGRTDIAHGPPDGVNALHLPLGQQQFLVPRA